MSMHACWWIIDVIVTENHCNSHVACAVMTAKDSVTCGRHSITTVDSRNVRCTCVVRSQISRFSGFASLTASLRLQILQDVTIFLQSSDTWAACVASPKIANSAPNKHRIKESYRMPNADKTNQRGAGVRNCLWKMNRLLCNTRVSHGKAVAGSSTPFLVGALQTEHPSGSMPSHVNYEEIFSENFLKLPQKGFPLYTLNRFKSHRKSEALKKNNNGLQLWWQTRFCCVSTHAWQMKEIRQTNFAR